MRDTTYTGWCDMCHVIRSMPDVADPPEWDADFAIWKREITKDVEGIVARMRGSDDA